MSLILRKFKLNEEGRFSITRPYESEQITKHIIKFINNEIDFENCVLTDATACVGGDLVNFSNRVRHVNGVEINPENFSLLVENCSTFDCKNVTLMNADYLTIYNKIKQDIIYIDPVWGGVEYKLKNSIQLYVGDVALCDLVNTIRAEGISKYIFVKVPTNICLDKLVYDNIHIIYNRSKLPSFKLVCISV
jgi:predicted RNA methylase